MLSAGQLDPDTATALMDFREGHGGTLSGMTRYTDHLDDMPAIGYARSSLSADRIDRFLLLLYGHAANYQGRGSFFSTEQQSLYLDASNTRWRASLGEIQDSFCTPSQTLIASMTAMQLVDSERDNATVWIARGAPRRWYAGDADDGSAAVGGAAAPGVMFGATSAPSRWGVVTFSVGPQVQSTTAVTVSVDFSQPVGAVQHTPTLMVRIRDPTGTRSLASAVVSGAGASAAAAAAPDCEVVQVLPSKEIVAVRPIGKATAMQHCTILATFKQ